MLPGCEGANWEQYQVAAASPYCREWAANAVNQPCPVYCNDIVASVRLPAGRRVGCCLQAG